MAGRDVHLAVGADGRKVLLITGTVEGGAARGLDQSGTGDGEKIVTKDK